MNPTHTATLLLCGWALGCGGVRDGYHREPSSAQLTLQESAPHPTAIHQQRRVFVQLIVDQGLWCDDGLDGVHCSDPPPAPAMDFELIDAGCDADACELVSVRRDLPHLAELTVVPRSASALLKVRARAGAGEGQVEAASEYRFVCDPQ